MMRRPAGLWLFIEAERTSPSAAASPDFEHQGQRVALWLAPTAARPPQPAPVVVMICEWG